MNNLNTNSVNIVDLPDEILFLILKKLNMVDVLYSLIDVNQRFRRLSLDSYYINDLNMTNNITINSLYNQTSSIDTEILSKICEKVLVRIHDQINKLTADEYSIKKILAAGNYPQLYSLSLLNFDSETISKYLTDDLILRNLLNKQITHVNIGIKPDNFDWRTISEMFSLILSLCEKLTIFNIDNIFPWSRCWVSVCYSLKRCMSSTLIKLKVNLATFADCLWLLDGRLNSLSILIINVEQIFESAWDIVEKKKLPKLQYFSFTTFKRTEYYDKLIVPLLCRMVNLEELKLYIPVSRWNSTFIDGIQLYDQFLVYMTKLKKFAFNIDTQVSDMKKEIQSNEDIQCSFIGKGYEQVASYINTYSSKTIGKCRIYSFPYQFEYFVNLNNCFQRGIFDKVRYLTMMDTIGLKLKLFQVISQDFPYLEYLSISNRYQQKKNKSTSSTLIVFRYLKYLDLKDAHVDYAKLLLLKINVDLPCLVNLKIEYESLIIITNSFTNDAKHFNFNKLIHLDACQPFNYPQNFHQYFPLL